MPTGPELARWIAARRTIHRGVFITSPEYSASVTPLLKNAIDWITRVRERNDGPYAAFKDRVFALASASARADGGLHALMALRQILEVGCGALVLPEQINVGGAGDAFDEMDNLKDQGLTTALKDMVRRLIDLAGMMPKGTQ